MKLREALAAQRHPDARRALTRALNAVTQAGVHDAQAVELEAQLDALTSTQEHPAAILQAVGRRVHESTRAARLAWRAAHSGAQVEQNRARTGRGNLYPVYQPLAAPRPGEKGFSPPMIAAPGALDGSRAEDVARRMLRNALELYEDPDLGMLMAPDGEEADEETAALGFSLGDLPDLVGVPILNPQGQRYTDRQRMGLAEDCFALASEVRGEGVDRAWTAWRELRDRPSGRLPRAVAELVIEDALQPRMVNNDAPRLVAVSKEEAADFINAHHSKLPRINMRGIMYTLGLRVNGRLVAVATAGSPSGNHADAHRVLDVTRIASDGTHLGASSALMARMMDLVDRSARPGATGPSVLVTYSLLSEAGTTYRALKEKGLRPVAITESKSGGGARQDDEAALKGHRKIRWEYGPGAAPADWSLLEQAGAPAPAPATAPEVSLVAKANGLQQGLFTAQVPVKAHLAHDSKGGVHVVRAHRAARAKRTERAALDAEREQVRLPTGRAPAAVRTDTRPTLLSVFSGAGGETLGFKQAGYRPVAMVERNAHAVSTLRAAVTSAHLEGEVVEADAAHVDFSRWRGVDLLTGGPPCQPFSKAGKLLGRFDPRDGYPHFLRAVQEARPRHVLAENVANLMSPRFADYRELIERRLQDLGYDCSWEQVNAADYDSGQERHRVLLLAWRKGEEPFTLPKPKPKGVAGRRTAADALIDAGVFGHRPDDMLDPPPSAETPTWQKKHPPTAIEMATPSRTVVARHGAGTVNLVRVDYFAPGTAVTVYDDEEEGLERLLGGSYYDSLPDEDADDAEIEAWEKRFDRILDQHGVTWGRGEVEAMVIEDRGNTIVVDAGHGPELHPRTAVRSSLQTLKRAPLPWIAALQGFPPNYPFQGGLNAVGTQIGNAIPVTLARAVGRHLKRTAP